LDFADKVRVAAGDGQLQKVARHRFVRRCRQNTITVEVLIRIQALGRLLQRCRRRYEIEAAALLNNGGGLREAPGDTG
jgi:hypothetical protein